MNQLNYVLKERFPKEIIIYMNNEAEQKVNILYK